MAGNFNFGQRPNSLELKSEFSKDSATNFPFPPPNSVSDLFWSTMSGEYYRGANSSLDTSPTTPRYEWSSSSESNSPPGGQIRYGRPPFDFSNAMPEDPPSDIFTPSLIRRPPISQTLNQKVKYNFCVFCKNNGEDENYYLSHTLKNDHGHVTCPILYNYKCPICEATGPVSHTIRYCPLNKDHSYKSEMAHITVLKQMRSSAGKRSIPSGPGVIGGPVNAMPPSLPPSKRPMAQMGARSMVNLRGPNAAWSGMTTQPCLTPMYGELLNQEARDRRDRERTTATSELISFASSFEF